MRRRHLLTLLLPMFACFPVASQELLLPLAGNRESGGLYLNLDRLWSYNLYEQSRWGCGLRWISAQRKKSGTQVTLDGYVGYGIKDRQWKGGIGNEIRFGRSRYGLTQYLFVGRDYHAVGSRNLAVGSYADPSSLATFMNRRLSDWVTGIWGYRWHTNSSVHHLEAQVMVGGRLFDNERLLYHKAGDTIAKEEGVELRWLMKTPQGFSSQIELGGMWPQRRLIARLLTQYDHQWTLAAFKIHTFAQAGLTAPRTPYTHMFDMGGTWSAPLCFRNSLLTARPNEFTANLFAFLSLRFGWDKPVISGWNHTLQIGTAPRPFIGCNIVWGLLYKQNGTGQLHHEGMELQAPYQGIVEPQAGIEGLIRWGIVDWGMAVAYRMVPTAAVYHLDATQDNLALLITATLIF